MSFAVPAGTPPSRDGEPAFRWRLKLHGTIDYWPDVTAEYEVRILPPDPQSEVEMPSRYSTRKTLSYQSSSLSGRP